MHVPESESVHIFHFPATAE